MCSVCGSQKYETQWIFGVTTGEGAGHTKLEKWIIENHDSHEHKWCSIAGTGHNIFGQSMSFSHGPAPAIYSFAQLGFGDEIVTSLSPEEIERFVETMAEGSSEEREVMAQETSDKIMKEKYGE